MVRRTKRANAGNRLQSLLAQQAPLDEDDAKLFAERDDDEDFDIEAEEVRRKQKRKYRSDEEDDEEGEESDDDDSENVSARDDKKSEEDSHEDVDNEESDENSESNHDDSNFSDTTDDSELENDPEPQDAGEMQLKREQRRSLKEKRIAERNKMFIIKKRPVKDVSQPPKAKKPKHIFTSADLMAKHSRKPERKSAMRNKQHLIEKMKAAEERRAQYVPPKRVKVPKLTQEQRLEEAKLTEIKNLNTLNKFVELEEERKIQQRLAMISKRPKLTHFVRFRSCRCLEPPKLIEVKEEVEDFFKDDELPKPNVETTTNEGQARYEEDASVGGVNNADGKLEGNKEELTDPQLVKIGVKEESESTKSESSTRESEITKPETNEIKKEVKEEPSITLAPLVEGPAYLHSYEFLSLHDFHDVHINRFSIRSIILGSSASQYSQPPAKRMCPFSGQPAKFIDPSTKVGYMGLETYKLIKLTQENKLGWNQDLGGVFTHSGVPQRPARGVPEGFLE